MPTTHEGARICTLKTQERSTKVIAETPEDEEETTNVMVTPVETSLELQSEGEGMLIIYVVNKLHHVSQFSYS